MNGPFIAIFCPVRIPLIPGKPCSTNNNFHTIMMKGIEKIKNKMEKGLRVKERTGVTKK
jgi:hypothetical protein